ncbi:WhiB family transcriptional regulator [Rhodococcus koreensis]|uniref:WhiB family transcriptional regulator n=1 Tax=Rhodococcus koreensis TaxID=99653 RepID=UPI0019803C10|nr:WhiB family transcriptional regulator [Rhodococcus koreensis]QSE81166.1 WhiB family transcriptional regulator [Rhodococcus koreensis]
MTCAANPVRPAHDTWAWRLHALCRSMDPYLFFAPEDEPKGPRVRREREAKRICLRCPVLDQYREYALSAREGYGVWGGTSELDRRTAFTTTNSAQNTAQGAPSWPSATSSSSPSCRTCPPRH